MMMPGSEARLLYRSTRYPALGPINKHSFPRAATEIPGTVLQLAPGERITDCFPLWTASDRIVEELSKCQACQSPTFRVVTILSVYGLERRITLCGRHFVQAARRVPALKEAGKTG
jgi:hypothetical protein